MCCGCPRTLLPSHFHCTLVKYTHTHIYAHTLTSLHTVGRPAAGRGTDAASSPAPEGPVQSGAPSVLNRLGLWEPCHLVAGSPFPQTWGRAAFWGPSLCTIGDGCTVLTQDAVVEKIKCFDQDRLEKFFFFFIMRDKVL